MNKNKFKNHEFLEGLFLVPFEPIPLIMGMT